MNTSGIRPIEYNVLVKPHEVQKTTTGGLHLPDQHVEREAFSQTRGVLVAKSPMAFTFEDWPSSEKPPQVGQEVFYARNAGVVTEGVDGAGYRVLKDRDVIAVIADEVSA
jgi:co-chaperonin GroES (HSP10)